MQYKIESLTLWLPVTAQQLMFKIPEKQVYIYNQSMIILFCSDDIYPGVSWDCPFELLDIHTDYKDISYLDV